ncbi:hypothetical protein [Streptomyces sp. AJS327]|uniref:hypothetical protein n=1 Tax=Streptomyces sp. AJS327 TaxID=2545265 RepID=UPI0035B50407
MLEGPAEPVPPDLAGAAARRGARLRRGRRVLRRFAWGLLAVLVVALVVWVALESPWSARPVPAPPPMDW